MSATSRSRWARTDWQEAVTDEQYAARRRVRDRDERVDSYASWRTRSRSSPARAAASAAARPVGWPARARGSFPWTSMADARAGGSRDRRRRCRGRRFERGGRRALPGRAVERFGRVDLHHLNAGIPGSLDPFPELDLAGFERVMAVNVTSVFLGLRGAFRQYATQGSGGAVVVTGSIASLRGSADLFAYHTSKHAVLGLARCAAVYGGPLGVRVNVIAPGIVPTELFAGAGVPSTRWRRRHGSAGDDDAAAATGHAGRDRLRGGVPAQRRRVLHDRRGRVGRRRRDDDELAATVRRRRPLGSGGARS